MAKISSGFGTALLVGLAILGVPAVISGLSGDQDSTSSLSNSYTNVNYETSNEGTSAVPQKVSCSLGQCGSMQLSEEDCANYVCCQIGTKYTIVSSKSLCTSQQEAYLKSITPAPVVSPTYTAPTTNSTACCKYCTTGKACGDSCISKSYTCHKAPGCACNR